MKRFVSFIEKKHLWIFSTLLLLSLLPLLIFQGQSVITIHDNLDSEIPIRVVLAKSGTMFDDRGEVEQIMNGLPRTAMTSGLNVVMLLFWLFPPLPAYIINYIFVHIVAFIGMYLLLRIHIIKEDNLIASGVAFCFSFLPFYAIYGLSIAGLPLLLYTILNIRSRKESLSGYLFVFLFPLYSSLLFVGIFILVSLSIWLMIDLVQKKPIRSLFMIIFLLSISYGIVEHGLILAQFGPEKFLSHRSEWSNWADAKSIPFSEAIEISISNWVNGQYHAVSLHRYILLILVPITILYGIICKRNLRLIIKLLFVTAIISISMGFSDWNAWVPMKERINLLSEIQVRFYWFSPLLWYMVFALALDIFLKNKFGVAREIFVIAISLSLFGQTIYIEKNSPELIDTISVAIDSVIGKQNQIITYNGFYSEELFKNIQKDIDKPQSSYRIVSIGIHPGITQYNGFYTLDSYQNNYSLDYKKEFRKIIAAELEKKPSWEFYFDSWGSRCYVFSSELDSYLITKFQSQPIHKLQLNSSALREIAEGKDVYVFSAVDILNFKENNLDFINYYESDKSPWGIYVYKVD